MSWFNVGNGSCFRLSGRVIIHGLRSSMNTDTGNAFTGRVQLSLTGIRFYQIFLT